MASAWVRDRLLMIGIAILLCFLGVGSFFLADQYHINDRALFIAWGSFVVIPALGRAFRGHLKRPFMVPFLAGLTIVHVLVCIGLVKWQVTFVYWLPVFIVEFALGAWAAYRFFGIIPSSDI